MKMIQFVKHISRISHIPVSVCDMRTGHVQSFSDREEFRGMLELEPAFLESRKARLERENPLLLRIREEIFCALIQGAFGTSCVLGPVYICDEYDEAVYTQPHFYTTLEYGSSRVINCDLERFCRIIVMVYEFMSGKLLTVSELLERSFIARRLELAVSDIVRETMDERRDGKNPGGGVFCTTPIFRRRRSLTVSAAAMWKD